LPHRPLKCKVVECVLRSLGFTQEAASGTSHVHWHGFIDGIKRKVTVDCHRGEVRALDVRSIIGQAGISQKQFWRLVERC